MAASSLRDKQLKKKNKNQVIPTYYLIFLMDVVGKR